MQWLMTVGQISKFFNVTSETLRHYDRIDLLKPMINKENGYRYYSIEEMEKLDLILDAKYLEIPLSNIKEYISNESIENYTELIELQEKTIDEKIDHLLKLKEQAKEKKKIFNEMMNFQNNYDFDTLEIVEESETLIFIPTEDIIKGKIKQIDTSSKSLYLEPWKMVINVKGYNNIIEDIIDDEEYLSISEKDMENLIIQKDVRIKKKNYNRKVIKTKFVGTKEDTINYTQSVIKYFYKDNTNFDLDISVSWIWSVYKEHGAVEFVEISIPLI